MDPAAAITGQAGQITSPALSRRSAPAWAVDGSLKDTSGSLSTRVVIAGPTHLVGATSRCWPRPETSAWHAERRQPPLLAAAAPPCSGAQLVSKTSGGGLVSPMACCHIHVDTGNVARALRYPGVTINSGICTGLTSRGDSSLLTPAKVADTAPTRRDERGDYPVHPFAHVIVFAPDAWSSELTRTHLKRRRPSTHGHVDIGGVGLRG